MAKNASNAADIAQFTGHPDFPANLTKGQELRLGEIAGVFARVEGGRFVVLVTEGGVRKFLARKLVELYPPVAGAPEEPSPSPAPGLVVAVTGHVDVEGAFRRSAPQGGQAYDPAVRMRVAEELALHLETVLCPRLKAQPESLTLVCGMARGVDEITAFHAMEHGLPLICVIPNSVRWHQSRPAVKGVRAQALEYERILAYEGTRVVTVTKDYAGGPYPYANFARNQAMVDLADQVLSWKRRESAGTEDCIARARAAGKYFGNVKSLGPLADRVD